MPDCDLLIRNATVIDGTGAEPYAGDVAITGGRIVSTAAGASRGHEEIDARGLVLTPGFVDIHTHFDGQVTWSNRLEPSSNHGATTVVMGNCGVGFAPFHAQDRDLAVRMMEGVEDIPGDVLRLGLPWQWTSFPEYLDFLASRQFDADVAAYVPHSPLRLFVMGERGMAREPATPDDIREMARLVSEAVKAGAVGFATARTLQHRTSDGLLMPPITAGESELLAIAQAMAALGRGVIQINTDFRDAGVDFGLLSRLVAGSGVPLSFSLMQFHDAPDNWRKVLDLLEQATAQGLPIKAQVSPRPIGIMMGLEGSRTPFSATPTYRALAGKPFAERLAALRRPEVREAILGEFRASPVVPGVKNGARLDNIYEMTPEADYVPGADQSVEAAARRAGIEPIAYVYDLLASGDGRTLLYNPAVNFHERTTDAVRTMISHPDTLIGLGDGGAHVRGICDASIMTYLLTHCVGGGDLALPCAIRALTSRNAEAVGFTDRGVIAPGYRADLNLIDMDRLALHRPYVAYDLPGGGAQLKQEATGYAATFVNGIMTRRDGAPTGALPGRLARSAPAAAPARTRETLAC